VITAILESRELIERRPDERQPSLAVDVFLRSESGNRMQGPGRAGSSSICSATLPSSCLQTVISICLEIEKIQP
jgi:hypothetical protein